MAHGDTQNGDLAGVSRDVAVWLQMVPSTVAAGTMIRIYRLADESLHCVGSTGPRQAEHETVSIDQGPYGYALHQGTVYLPQGDDGDVESNVCLLGARSELFLALHAPKAVWGLVYLERPEPEAFTPEHIAAARRWVKGLETRLAAIQCSGR